MTSPSDALSDIFYRCRTKGMPHGPLEVEAGRHLEFFEKAIIQGPQSVSDELAFFIKADRTRLEDFLFNFPNQIGRLNLDKAFIRGLWRTPVFLGYRSLKIVMSMCRAGLIPVRDLPPCLPSTLTS